jgi:hypothetical protein
MLLEIQTYSCDNSFWHRYSFWSQSEPVTRTLQTPVNLLFLAPNQKIRKLSGQILGRSFAAARLSFQIMRSRYHIFFELTVKTTRNTGFSLSPNYFFSKTSHPSFSNLLEVVRLLNKLLWISPAILTSLVGEP